MNLHRYDTGVMITPFIHPLVAFKYTLANTDVDLIAAPFLCKNIQGLESHLRKYVNRSSGFKKVAQPVKLTIPYSAAVTTNK